MVRIRNRQDDMTRGRSDDKIQDPWFGVTVLPGGHPKRPRPKGNGESGEMPTENRRGAPSYTSGGNSGLKKTQFLRRKPRVVGSSRVRATRKQREKKGKGQGGAKKYLLSRLTRCKGYPLAQRAALQIPATTNQWLRLTKGERGSQLNEKPLFGARQEEESEKEKAGAPG